jgi:hypothetical protein
MLCTRVNESLKRCHSERSEESHLDCLFADASIEERFFASLRMTTPNAFSAPYEAAIRKTLS